MARIEQETMGSRIARLRRDKGMTQAELAERLDVSQPVISDYENNVIKLSGETVAQLAGLLGVSADEILGLEKSATTKAPIKNRRLYRQLASIDKLPKRDQEALLRTIDAFLTKAG
ncbi:MAG: helix-turn-helix transcriptional regulator [Betaproteobacteria bacterium]